MKKRELEEHLGEHDCWFVGHGKKHDIWENAVADHVPLCPVTRTFLAAR